MVINFLASGITEAVNELLFKRSHIPKKEGQCAIFSGRLEFVEKLSAAEAADAADGNTRFQLGGARRTDAEKNQPEGAKHLTDCRFLAENRFPIVHTSAYSTSYVFLSSRGRIVDFLYPSALTAFEFQFHRLDTFDCQYQVPTGKIRQHTLPTRN